MGRIIFDANAFRPSMYRADTREPESRSQVASMWLSPQGILTAATLAKMAGGLKLPSGWRDEGVDANAEALKVAAQARHAAKQKTETTDEAKDEAAMRMVADVKPETLADMRDETIVRGLPAARDKAAELAAKGDIQGAKAVLAEAGDRIGQTSLQLTPDERTRRQSEQGRLDMDRQKRLATRPRRTRVSATEQLLGRDEPGADQTDKELQEGAVRDATAVEPERAAEAFNEAIRLAKEGAPSAGSVTVQAGDTLGEIARRAGVSVSDIMANNPQIKDPNMIRVGETIRMPGAAAEAAVARDAYEFSGLSIGLEDLRGEGSEKLKAMSREQLRDQLVHFKQGGREALMAELSNQGLDQQEVAAFEEMLIGQMNRRRSQESGVRRLMTAEQEEKLTDETIDAFHAEKRREDPYYGMRPEDAMREIMIDAPFAKTEAEQRKLKAAMVKYTPKYQTFSDLFFDNVNERSMANLANLNKLLPDAEKELTELEKAKQTLELFNLTDELNLYKSLPPDMQPAALKLKERLSVIRKNNELANKARRAARSGDAGSLGASLDVFRKSFDKDTDAHFQIDSLKANAAAQLKNWGTQGEQMVQAIREKDYESLAGLMGQNPGMPKEARAALNALREGLEMRDNYRSVAGDALTNAQAMAKAGNMEGADKALRKFMLLRREAGAQEMAFHHRVGTEMVRWLVGKIRKQ